MQTPYADTVCSAGIFLALGVFVLPFDLHFGIVAIVQRLFIEMAIERKASYVRYTYFKVAVSFPERNPLQISLTLWEIFGFGMLTLAKRQGWQGT